MLNDNLATVVFVRWAWMSLLEDRSMSYYTSDSEDQTLSHSVIFHSPEVTITV